MKPASFQYHRPASVREALELLATHGSLAKLISGGQSLGPMMNMRLASPDHLIDINDLTELAGIRDRGSFIEVGTLTRHCEVEKSAVLSEQCPLLPQAAATIGHYAIRQRGTLGGSLAHADPAAQMALVARTLGAVVILASLAGEREISAAQFFEGAMTTALRADEMIVRVRYPKFRADELSAFQLFSRRHGDYALVSVAVVLRLHQGLTQGLRIGINGASPVPNLLDDIASAFEGRVPDATWVDELSEAVGCSINPEENGRVPAAYRRELARELTRQVLNGLLTERKAGVL